MMLRTGINHNGSHPLWRVRGFTLIELILVMGILSAVVVVSAPSLSRFFYGQALGDEVRRFLTLTEYAKSQAVSTGIPYMLWIEPATGSYGLQKESGFEIETNTDEHDYPEIGFQVDDEIKIELLPTRTTNNGMVYIYFKPDGTIDQQDIQLIRFTRDEKDTRYIERAPFGMRFQITDEENVLSSTIYE